MLSSMPKKQALSFLNKARRRNGRHGIGASRLLRRGSYPLRIVSAISCVYEKACLPADFSKGRPEQT